MSAAYSRNPSILLMLYLIPFSTASKLWKTPVFLSKYTVFFLKFITNSLTSSGTGSSSSSSSSLASSSFSLSSSLSLLVFSDFLSSSSAFFDLASPLLPPFSSRFL